VKENLDTLVARLGVTYRDNEAAYLLTKTTDPANAEELMRFAPMRQTAGGRISTDRAADTILTSAEVAARVLPAVEVWLAEHKR
jgi:hypothetical protein